MNSWNRFGCVALLAGVSAANAMADEAAPVAASPEAALNLLFTHLAQGDGEGALMLFHPESPTRSRFDALARQSRGEFENVAGMLGGLGAVLASALAPQVTVAEADTADTRARLQVRVTSAAVPGFTVEAATELWRDTAQDGGARWLFYDEELLSAYLNEGKGATPEIAAETLRVMTEYAERARNLRETEQLGVLAEARATPESCARAYLRFLAQGRPLELLALRHPDSREGRRLAELQEQNEDAYRAEVLSFSEACQIVFEELLLEPRLEPAGGEESTEEPEADAAVETRAFVVSLNALHRESLTAGGKLVLRKVAGEGEGTGWFVWESTVEDAMFKMGFESGGSVARRLEALMEETERRIQGLRPVEAPAPEVEPADSDEEAGEITGETPEEGAEVDAPGEGEE